MPNRTSTHGDFAEVSAFSQACKDLMRAQRNWSRLTSIQREALDMSAHKMARALVGDPTNVDHWDDNAQYVRMAAIETDGKWADYLREGAAKPQRKRRKRSR